ncbi:hypothetical protein PI95_030405 [Hassallia byssoidea VB512170]|uniref:Uncharacterized protein n=1 Tax=Hassallia byssoidea VB512170 TaxID=1304833 RepID=A0A846HH87_9CYAN|nr:hypothetical protein [Hassalia byssoidea]NEU76705.1 hypothetical protein [Hassalia byssoidea VB512170]
MRKDLSLQFLPYTLVSALGLGLLFLPQFISVRQNLVQAAAESEILTTENINRDRIKQRAQTAALMRKSGLLPEGKTLTILDYVDNPKRPPGIAKKRLNAYLSDEVVHVYDETRTCIGVIKNRQFLWKREHAATCVDAPVINTEE